MMIDKDDNDFDCERFDTFVVKYKSFRERYLFRKWIFNTAFLLVLGLLLLTWVDVGGGDPRNIFFGKVECPVSGGGCENPLFYCNTHLRNNLCESVPSDWYVSEWLAPGTLFELPVPFVVKFFGLIVLLVFGLSFGLNHVLNVRGKRK